MRKIEEAAQVSLEIGKALADEDIHVHVITNKFGYLNVIYNGMDITDYSLNLIKAILVKITGMRWSYYIKAHQVNYLYPECSITVDFRSLEHLLH